MTRGDAGSSGGGPAGPFRTRDLGSEEIRRVLERNWWGTLATPGVDGLPYAVPVVYGWDGRAFHFIAGEGEKVRVLESDPSACLTVVEVEGDGDDWWSVVGRGRVEFLEEDADRLHAVRALRRQRGREGEPGPEVLRRVEGARVLRLLPARLTGRTRDREAPPAGRARAEAPPSSA